MAANRPVATPRKLVALIAGITVVPLGLFVWLGLRLLQQDRALEQQHARDRLHTASDLIVAALQRGIAATEQKVIAGAPEWSEDAVVLTLDRDRIEIVPPRRLAFLPVAPPLRPVRADRFRDGEALEFQQRNWSAAIAAYRTLAASNDPTTRSGALLRLGRTLAAGGRYDDALATYAKLRSVDDVAEAGVPVGLAAAWAICTALERLGRTSHLRAEASRLHADLVSGRWPVSEAAYVTYLADAERWAGIARRSHRAERFATAVSRLRAAGAAAGDSRDRWRHQSLVVDGELLTVLSRTFGSASRVFIAAPPYVDGQWLAPAAALAHDQMVAFQLRGDAGDVLPLHAAGSPRAPAGAPTVTVAPAQSDLPWGLSVWSTAPPVSAGFQSRQRLLIGAFALLATLSLAASWLIVRAVRRELAVARLQSDFVAAVSHEFRTPLTTLRQFTDRLREQPGLDEQAKRVCYDAQARATDRLTRLVESVLDFGRMDAGARAYRFERRDCGEIVQRVVDDFRAEPQASGRPIALHRNGPVPVEADEEALSRAVWNLLDNAVKYSPDGGPIEVGLASREGVASIAVRDHGLGIPAHERQAIFGRFERGEAAKRRGIKGTGIGLAMVDHIVRAHRGRIEIESSPGAGSTFTIMLPEKG